MWRLHRLGGLGLAFSLAPTSAYAVVPASTSLEAAPSGMSPLAWFTYGTVVIVLLAVLAAAVVLVARLVQALFAPNAPRFRGTRDMQQPRGANDQQSRPTHRKGRG